MIFVNFKTYKEGTAQAAVSLVQEMVSVQTETKVPVIPVVQAVDARLCVNTSGYSVWVQHVDFAERGRSTGWVTLESLAETGIAGVFLNHSEHKFSEDKWSELASLVERCRKAAIETMVFASDLTELHSVVSLKPTYAAYEPPELIASPDSSVATSQPEIIRQAVEVCEEAKIPLIVGAGIKTRGDVEVSLQMGAKGVAVSSAVVLAEDPRQVLVELAEGFR